MSEKECGDCRLCCKLIYSEELEKPSLQWCKHCNPTGPKGCQIHGEHPKACKSFECLWLEDPGMPEDLKPSNSKVVLKTSPVDPHIHPFEQIIVARTQQKADIKDIVSTSQMSRFLRDRIIGGLIVVVLNPDGQGLIYYPDKKVVDFKWSPTSGKMEVTFRLFDSWAGEKTGKMKFNDRNLCFEDEIYFDVIARVSEEVDGE